MLINEFFLTQHFINFKFFPFLIRFGLKIAVRNVVNSCNIKHRRRQHRISIVQKRQRAHRRVTQIPPQRRRRVRRVKRQIRRAMRPATTATITIHRVAQNHTSK